MAGSTASLMESTMVFMEGAVGVVIVLYLAGKFGEVSCECSGKVPMFSFTLYPLSVGACADNVFEKK
jgi:hypothetical protein